MAAENLTIGGASIADWAGVAAVVIAIVSYLTVEWHRRSEEEQKLQDAAYQIGYKLATLMSEAMTTHRTLYPEGTTHQDWVGIGSHFDIVRKQQPAVGFNSTMTRDLTDTQQNLLMSLREEDFLMNMSEAFARNETIRQGIIEYTERYAEIDRHKPIPERVRGSTASFFLTDKQTRKLFPYVVAAGTLMKKLREMSYENVNNLRTMGEGFHPMMNKHYPDLHIHKIEEALNVVDPPAPKPVFQQVAPNYTLYLQWD